MKINEKQLGYKVQKEYSYSGIPIFADHGIHEGVFLEFMIHKFDHNISILILGAGAGAFDQRLIDGGYTNITAIDIEPTFYKANNSNIIQRDLNKTFSDLGKFDVIFAIEIIEHLENQFHFIRNIKDCLGDNGYCFLSTPNVESKFSRIGFFLFGNLHSFGQDGLKQFGHINPIHSHLLEHALNVAELDFVRKGEFSKFNFNMNSGMLFVKSVFIKLLGIFMSGSDNITYLYSIHRKSYE